MNIYNVNCKGTGVLFDFEKGIVKYTRKGLEKSWGDTEISFEDITGFVTKKPTVWVAGSFSIIVNGKKICTPKDAIGKTYDLTRVYFGSSVYKTIEEVLEKFRTEVRDVPISEEGKIDVPEVTYTPNGIIEEKEPVEIFVEYRKKCNICGKVYCFNSDDIKRNQELAKQAKRHANVGVLSALAGTRYDMYEQNKQVDAALNKIVDYSRCPNCNSTDIRDLSEEEFKSAMAANNTPASATVVQQASSADELKKFKELLDAGVITQEEFDAKKKQILGL